MTTIQQGDFGEEVEDGQLGKFLTFHIENESYGIEIRYVTEIIGIQKVTQVPDVPDYVIGLINLRGKVVPVVDVRLRFKKPARAYDDRTCIVVIHVEGLDVGLVVDTVSEVMSIPPDRIDKPPKLGVGGGHLFMMGLGKIGDDVKILLDAKRLLFEGRDLSAMGNKG